MFEERMEVIFNQKGAHGTFLMGLKSPEVSSEALPGQFVMIQVRDAKDPLLRRPFSICGLGEGGVVLILYRVVGRGTALLAECRPGETLSVLGPLGRGFDLSEEDHRPLLVAGGIGMAPLLFLSQHLTRKQVAHELMVGFRTKEEIFFPDEILQPSVEISIATDDGSQGHNGPVTDLLDIRLGPQERRAEAVRLFTCGPEAMLRRVAGIAAEKGIPCQVSLEAAMACGLGACLGCAVKGSEDAGRPYLHVCKDGPVMPSRWVDWGIR
jgi:dihydroorotate dehydrogenase electron transfer subunit